MTGEQPPNYREMLQTAMNVFIGGVGAGLASLDHPARETFLQAYLIQLEAAVPAFSGPDQPGDARPTNLPNILKGFDAMLAEATHLHGEMSR